MEFLRRQNTLHAPMQAANSSKKNQINFCVCMCVCACSVTELSMYFVWKFFTFFPFLNWTFLKINCTDFHFIITFRLHNLDLIWCWCSAQICEKIWLLNRIWFSCWVSIAVLSFCINFSCNLHLVNVEMQLKRLSHKCFEWIEMDNFAFS